jgi:hypothetical protein
MTVAKGDGEWWGFSPELRQALEQLSRLQRPLIPSTPALDALSKATRMQVQLAPINALALKAAMQPMADLSKIYATTKLPAGLLSVIESSRQMQALFPTSNNPALRAAIADFSKVLPTFPATNTTMAAAFGRLAQGLSITVNQHYEDLVELVEEASSGSDDAESGATELTDFQAWVLVRIWVASLVFGWAVEDKLRGLSESERAKRGAMYSDVRNKVIAAVIVAALGAMARIGWDVAGGE